MIPGVGKSIKDIDISNDSFKGIEAMIGSMTPYERANPDTIDQSRRKRIAKGSGKELQEVKCIYEAIRTDETDDEINEQNAYGRHGLWKTLNFPLIKKEDKSFGILSVMYYICSNRLL